ncbi:MAG: ATP-binding protein [Pseudomonadota bacterium]
MVDDNLAAVLNGLSVAIFVVDCDQIIRFRNSAAVSLFGSWTQGTKLPSLVPNKRCIRAIENVLDGDKRASVSVKLQLVVPTAFRMTAQRLNPEAPFEDAQVVVSFEDVSHILEAEQMRSDFVANVSHELRSPLTTLVGFIETLQGHARNDREATTRFLALMAQEAERMARLIDDLLSLSKLQTVERYAPTLPVSPMPVVARVVAALEPILEQERVRVDLHEAAPLPDILGNADELTQVFRNIIENAAKYSRADSVVTVTGALDEADPQMVRITVTDQGDGIAPEHITRLTERFYRIDKGRSRDKGGTGLGLAIVKHILMRHRGRLQIDSAEGEGSRFSVLLPIMAEPA